MKKQLLIIFVLGLMGIPAIAQDMAQFKDLTDEIFKLGLTPYEVKNYKDIQGSPYLNDELSDGKIITVNDKVLIGKLRYNIYTDEIEFQYKNSVMSFAKPDNFKEFYIDKQKIIYANYIDGKRHHSGFMLVSREGKYSLLVRKSVLYFAKERQQPYSSPKPDRFEKRSDTYYLKVADQPAIKIVSMKKLSKAFPNIEPIIKTYSKKTVDFDKLEEIEELVDFINSQSSKD